MLVVLSCEIFDENFSTKVFSKNLVQALLIDVERHELNVLEGSINLLKNNQILMQIEILNSKKKIVFDMLIKNNYHHHFSIDDDHFFSNFIKV